MTHSSYLVSFLLLFTLLFGVVASHTTLASQYGITSHQYSQNLTRACQDAVSCNTTAENNCLFDTKNKRTKAVTTFYKTLSDGFNMTYDSNAQQELTLHVPLLCLIDNDGYYIVYNVFHDGDSGRELSQTITPINTWAVSGQNQDYNIRYYLNDVVEVTENSTGLVKTGSYKEVYDYFGRPVGLSLLDESVYYEEKYSYITKDMEEKLEHYINQYNYTVNRMSDGIRSEFGLYYTFTLPEISNADWTGLLSRPSCTAFLQGVKIEGSSQYINVYAMSRGKQLSGKLYYVTEDSEGLIYHREDCLYVGNDSKSYATKQECAAHGAFPCQLCNP